MGRDLSCLVSSDCRPENEAALLTSHSAALVGSEGILAHGFKSGVLRRMDLSLRHARDVDQATAPAAADQLRRLRALAATSVLLVDQNRVWSWAEFGRTVAEPSWRARPTPRCASTERC